MHSDTLVINSIVGIDQQHTKSATRNSFGSAYPESKARSIDNLKLFEF